jgi:hypothetical protein
MCLVERSANSKGKNKREETEKLEAELERSLAVAKVKAAHKQIEDTEKSRKRATVLSICKRTDEFLYLVKRMMPTFIKCRKEIGEQMFDTAMTNIEDFERTYTSISYDFQKNLDVGDEVMERMFPVIEIRKDTLTHAIDDLQCVNVQVKHMKLYCERLVV